MSLSSIAEQRLAAYCRAKDGNRPHLMAQTFAHDAWLETAVDGDVYCPPSQAHGREAITRALVCHFGRTYENVYTFCLQRPGLRWDDGAFHCDWLAGMSLKDGGQLRVGCGRYEWSFQPEAPHLVQGLRISIGVMKVLPASSLDVVVDWLAQLPYPWCSAAAARDTAPDLPALRPVLNYLGRRCVPEPLQDAA